ncbi:MULTISPECIES: mechanosensitive ion channel domain-containing protein [Salinimicrobium]|jgi:small-conductance mechanosensitive channel|uniref:Mechanosensitive ion channel n=1 Tax=Salinimicrobium profundisediminis TaxID=2994553 RepID=A0A9X3I1P9_9FLAO|nr:mechanosensitive ion channel domain-containing protein [Salinimicrobium profundisediminis]MCX2839300.1 mechanosensitive ion channel [Salinimicrobium profundisediminis]
MLDVFFLNKNQIITTAAILLALWILQFIMKKAAHRVGHRSEIHITRTRLMFKYINILVTIIAIFLLSLTWGYNAQEIALIFSSLFAIIGVAMFAIWSILSNITAGIILFFSFPYKIGSRIKIHDKDMPVEAVIEDIKAFHLHLRTLDGELITYPNNLILQKAVSLIEKEYHADEGKDAL